MPCFVFEIGAEEMPARFLTGLEQDLAEFFSKALADNALDFDAIMVSSTPRRCALTINNLAVKQRQSEEIVTGPAMAVAYGRDGNPTPAATGFARSHGVDLSEAFALPTDKGEYLAVRKKRGGVAASELLAGICRSAIKNLSFAKKMRWGCGSFAFGRPIRWLLAVLDREVIHFETAGVRSDRLTYGHRVMGLGPFSIEDAADFPTVLEKQGWVCLGAAERRARIIEQGNAIAGAAGGEPVWKDSLLEEVCGLIEWPKVIMGNFDPSFLELPKEVLLTSMERHQKSFGVKNREGSLMPCFLTVLNLESSDENLVRKGWERVLKARLEDARFFWKTDLCRGFEHWLKALEDVVFLASLGSMGDKSRRLERLARTLAEIVAPDMAADLAKAGQLAKADLASEMVGEFADLQGIMGGIYAEKSQMSQAASMAIYEHYLPLGPDSPVPGTVAGAVLALADKADTLAGCFGLGLAVTGTADPYALRRSAIGICRIIVDYGLEINLEELLRAAMDGYDKKNWKRPGEEALANLMAFMTQRAKVHLESQGFASLLVEAAVEAGVSDFKDLLLRLKTLRDFSLEPDFTQAALTFKRAANIIRKQSGQEAISLDGRYNQALLQETAEKNLAAGLESLGARFDALPPAKRYPAWPGLLRELRPLVDTFFEQVMVMCDDLKLRRNRLNLLTALVNRLAGLADFSKLQY